MDSVDELLSRAGFFIWPWVFALGACTGSFLNVVVYRLPRGQSLSYPGSRCPACGHAIRWYHNLPIVSWFWLRGKCYDCGAPFAFRYPLVELANALLFVGVAILELRPHAAAQAVGSGLTGTELAVRCVYHLWLIDTLLAVALIERDGQRIPRRIFWLALVVGLAGALACPAVQPLFAQVVPARWVLDSHLTAFAEAATGALTGLLAGWTFTLTARNQNRREASQPQELVSDATIAVGPSRLAAGCVGAFLGWQAPVLAGLLATVAWLAAGAFQRQSVRQPDQRPIDHSGLPVRPIKVKWGWNAYLLAASLGWLFASRLGLDHLPVWLP